MQFFNLSLKPNVLGVWIVKGGRKRSKSARVQLIIHSARHRTNLTLIELDNASFFFKLQAKQNTQKFWLQTRVQILKK